MPASEPFISKGTVEHSSNCEFLLKIYHFLFGSRFHRQNLPILKRSPLFTHWPLSWCGRLNNTLPFVSQSINNFSDCDISQTRDWVCPSLSPHVLLGWNTSDITKYELMKIIFHCYCEIAGNLGCTFLPYSLCFLTCKRLTWIRICSPFSRLSPVNGYMCLLFLCWENKSIGLKLDCRKMQPSH